MDKCLKQNKGYKDTHLSGKNGHVSDSRIRGTWCPLEKKEKKKKKKRERERETEKKKEKKMVAHGPSNKQYASKR